MELLGQLLVGVGLDAQRLANGEYLEKKRQSAAITLADFRRQKSLVVLDEIEEGALSLDIFRRQRGVGAHPQL
jgi:hypothetical protein